MKAKCFVVHGSGWEMHLIECDQTAEYKIAATNIIRMPFIIIIFFRNQSTFVQWSASSAVALVFVIVILFLFTCFVCYDSVLPWSHIETFIFWVFC